MEKGWTETIEAAIKMAQENSGIIYPEDIAVQLVRRIGYLHRGDVVRVLCQSGRFKLNTFNGTLSLVPETELFSQEIECIKNTLQEVGGIASLRVLRLSFMEKFNSPHDLALPATLYAEEKNIVLFHREADIIILLPPNSSPELSMYVKSISKIIECGRNKATKE